MKGVPIQLSRGGLHTKSPGELKARYLRIGVGEPCRGGRVGPVPHLHIPHSTARSILQESAAQTGRLLRTKCAHLRVVVPCLNDDHSGVLEPGSGPASPGHRDKPVRSGCWNLRANMLLVMLGQTIPKDSDSHQQC